MTYRELDEIVSEIIDEKNDRALIILIASIIEEQLYQLLKKFLIEVNDDDLLKGDSPLATFSAKIKIVWRLGIIDGSFKILLDQIRKIRNACAHSITFSVNRAPIKDHVDQIKRNIIKRDSYQLVISRYFNNSIEKANELKSYLITMLVVMHAINDSIDRIPSNNECIRVSLT